MNIAQRLYSILTYPIVNYIQSSNTEANTKCLLRAKLNAVVKGSKLDGQEIFIYSESKIVQLDPKSCYHNPELSAQSPLQVGFLQDWGTAGIAMKLLPQLVLCCYEGWPTIPTPPQLGRG